MAPPNGPQLLLRLAQQRPVPTLSPTPAVSAHPADVLEQVPVVLRAGLSAEQADQLRAVLTVLPPYTRASLNGLLSKGDPVLLQRDTLGQTMLGRLYELLTQPLDAAFQAEGIGRPDILLSVLTEVIDPGSIDQSFKTTCAATTLEYLLARQNPAELVRLVTGLVSPLASVVLANKDTLRRVKDSVAYDNSGRSISERVFQSAVMDSAKPGRYRNVSDCLKLNFGFMTVRHQGTLGMK